MTTVHLPSADAYTYLSIFFLALIALASLFYFSLGRLLLVYLVADWLIFWGALGAVSTFDLALLELSRFSSGSRFAFALVATVALAAVVFSRVQDAINTFEEANKRAAKKAAASAARVTAQNAAEALEKKYKATKTEAQKTEITAAKNGVEAKRKTEEAAAKEVAETPALRWHVK